MAKRILALSVVLSFALCSWACASEAGGGLGGLLDGGAAGGGLDGLLDESGSFGVVPDPAGLTGQEGNLLQEDYLFSAGYVCTAYAYPLPADEDAFLEAYILQAGQNGFSVATQVADGQEALRPFLEDGRYALLFPNVDGAMLLLVQEDLAFGEPEPDGFYLSLERNGRELLGTFSDTETSCTESTRMTGTSRSFEITYYFERAEITLFTLNFPNYAQKGDEFYVTKDFLIDGLYLYTAEEGNLVFYDSPYHHQMVNSKDYFRVKITDMYETEAGLVIEGEFDGSFQKGEILYTNGSFRVLNDL